MPSKPWSWTEVEGKNVLAIPSGTKIDIFDTRDFTLIMHIHSSGHDQPIVLTRWSEFHARLASISSTLLLVHAPRMNRSSSSIVSFPPIYRMEIYLTGPPTCHVSQCAEFLVLCGSSNGMSIYDISQGQNGTHDNSKLWMKKQEVLVAKFSPCKYILASLCADTSSVEIWRFRSDGASIVLELKQELEHASKIEYISWKPTSFISRCSESNAGIRTAQCGEPRRILMTYGVAGSISIWVETEQNYEPTFHLALILKSCFDVTNFRWILQRRRNFSEENPENPSENDKKQFDWISGVDSSGTLYLWQISGLSNTRSLAKVEKSTFNLRITGEDPEKYTGLQEVGVIGYFRQDLRGPPSNLDILIQRMDNVVLSFHVSLSKGLQAPRIKEKSWHRGQIGSIVGLATHPSLPLVASVDRFLLDEPKHEITIYWVALSPFSEKTRLVLAGLLTCDQENGDILCVSWVPTRHFDSSPLLTVAYVTGTLEIYQRFPSGADIVDSPKGEPVHKSPITLPSCSFDYLNGESHLEYEVKRQKMDVGIGMVFRAFGDKLYVTEFSNSHIHSTHEDLLSIGDELLRINYIDVKGMSAEEVEDVIQNAPVGSFIQIRLCSVSNNFVHYHGPGFRRHSSIQPSRVEQGISTETTEIRRSFNEFKLQEQVSKLYQTSSKDSLCILGGWCRLLNRRILPRLALMSVAPAYADDGEYIKDAFIIFGIEELPGKLHAWKVIWSDVTEICDPIPLSLSDEVIKMKKDIVSIGTERDYRQRAFSTERITSVKSAGMNSLLFLGDASGSVQHWRCRTIGNTISFTMMSLCCHHSSKVPAQAASTYKPISRRGYVKASATTDYIINILHIEVDDPNRIAVLFSYDPGSVYIFEGESGLGILKDEDVIISNGRGDVVSFTWCAPHADFNVDAIAIQFTHSIMVFQYDVNHHRWIPIGEEVLSKLSIFDCTRDMSALIIGAGDFELLSKMEMKWKKFSNPTEDYFHLPSNELPQIIAKWDEPGKLQSSMDWKTIMSPRKLPIWHPHVILATLFGMHARVGVKDTSLASDVPFYDFSKTFKDSVQMLKLLNKVLDDEESTNLSARSGVLMYMASRASEDSAFMTHIGNHGTIGRYSTAIHVDTHFNKAENLFELDIERNHRNSSYSECVETSGTVNLEESEMKALNDAIDSVLFLQENTSNANVLLGDLGNDNLVELKAIIHYIISIQNLGFEVNSSADLAAQRYFTMNLFSTSLASIVLQERKNTKYPTLLNEQASSLETTHDEEVQTKHLPSSAILWALHSDSQKFLMDHCIPTTIQWKELQSMWLGLWIKDVRDLRGIIERLAKVTYSKNKDVMEVCLSYVALGKKNILGALARLSKDERAKNLAIFLEHDFSQERWRNAAIKNAYSLLGKKDYQLAAAFFLLCEPPRLQEAIRILSVRFSDPSLTLIIARIVEHRISDDFQHDFLLPGGRSEVSSLGPISKQVIEEEIIPFSRESHDRWLESCALWWLERFEQACVVLLPTFQPIDIIIWQDSPLCSKVEKNMLKKIRSVCDFYINLTSLPLYFQHLYSKKDTALISWATSKLCQCRNPDNTEKFASLRKISLVSTTDIEHAFSFSAYVCKRNGLNDTALVEMLQARHLVNIHRKFDLSASTQISGTVVTSPRLKRRKVLASNLSESFTTDDLDRGYLTSRRLSKLNFSEAPNMLCRSPPKLDKINMPQCAKSANCHDTFSEGRMTLNSAPWLRTQIADMECRRWSSSAFVGKMIGLRVANEMISHFRSALDHSFRKGFQVPSRGNIDHKEFLSDLFSPLCEQFQVERTYVSEAALLVLQPHAQLHVVEFCFLLSELGQDNALEKWIHFLALSMLHSCATFVSCNITESVIRDWESLTIQLCYLLKLDGAGQLHLRTRVIAVTAVAVRAGCFFLAWCKDEFELVREAINEPFNPPYSTDRETNQYSDLSRLSFETNSKILCTIISSDRRMSTSRNGLQKFGFGFLSVVASNIGISINETVNVEEKSHKLRKLYFLVLMISMLRTFYAKAQLLLSAPRKHITVTDTESNIEEINASCSLFIPRKLWLGWSKSPLEGVKRWYTLLEGHVRTQFDYAMNKANCRCGLYGLECIIEELQRKNGEMVDDAKNDIVREVNFRNINMRDYTKKLGISPHVHDKLLEMSDEYVLALMGNPAFGVHPRARRFRVDPRVYIKCFLLKDAIHWLCANKIYSSPEESRRFLSRCCQTRKLRFLVKRRGEETHILPLNSHFTSKDRSNINDAMTFVDPWEVEAVGSTEKYMHHNAVPKYLELGWSRLRLTLSESCSTIANVVFSDHKLEEIWRLTCGDDWLITSITEYQREEYAHEYDKVEDFTSKSCTQKNHRTPYILEVYKCSQKNTLFKLLGLPYRFVAQIKVTLVEGKDFVQCNMLSHGSDPYVFFSLSYPDDPKHHPDRWNIQTYRSRVVVCRHGANPIWNAVDDEFVFRYSIPTHESHFSTNTAQSDLEKLKIESESFEGVYSIFRSKYRGPPTALHLSVFHKNILFPHKFMGKGKIDVSPLTSTRCIDSWVPLEGVTKGSVHLKISMSFQLLCSGP